MDTKIVQNYHSYLAELRTNFNGKIANKYLKILINIMTKYIETFCRNKKK